jgi:Pyruvate/2-oxoacid:ferredoxin oxidoreductase delta subunit
MQSPTNRVLNRVNSDAADWKTKVVFRMILQKTGTFSADVFLNCFFCLLFCPQASKTILLDSKIVETP